MADVGTRKTKILLVEDELNLGRGLKMNFDFDGHETEWVTTIADARKAYAAQSFDLIVLDLMLPDGSGLTFLTEVKSRNNKQPVMLLTAKAGDDDRVVGLAYGADDYVTKPFHLKELLLRVKGMIQRGQWYRETPSVAIPLGSCMLFPDKSAIERSGVTHPLTERELALLLYLHKKRGTYVSREELLSEVWAYSPGMETRTVDIFISRLRRALGDDAAEPAILLTKRGQGYMLVS